MNNKDRKEIERACELIMEGAQILGDIGDSELEKFENLPESLQQTERSQKFEENFETLITSKDEIENAISELDYIIC